MKNSKTIYIIAFTFFSLGMIGLFRFSEDVRTVNIAGLFFSGLLCGAAVVSLMRKQNKNTYRIIFGMVTLLAAHSVVVNAQISTSGNYTLTQTAIANGGASGSGASVGGPYSIEGTIGQSAAGQTANAASFSSHAGFWNAQLLGPSAAGVPVGGAVRTAAGQGIRNVRIALISGDGATRTALTGPSGYFRIDDVAVGQTYVLSVSSKRFQFAQPSQFLTILDEVTDLIFVSQE